MIKELRLSQPFGRSYDTEPGDVVDVKKSLLSLGLPPSDEDLSPFSSERVVSSVETFQGAAGLRRDSVIRPGDRTEQAINDALKNREAITPRLREFAARSPTFRCKECGGPHGGAFGRFCYDCFKYLFS